MEKYCSTCIYQTLPTKTISLHEKDTIFMEGDNLLYAFLIVEGLVKVSKTTITGEEKIFDIFGPNDFVALVAMLKKDDKYIATATCLTEVKLNLLRKDDVLEAYKSNNKFKDICLSCAMTRTNLFQSQLFTSSNSDVEEKILLVLEFLTKKFGKIEGTKHILELSLPKAALASIVGIRRETLSRKLTIMQKEGSIVIDKNKYVFNRM